MGPEVFSLREKDFEEDDLFFESQALSVGERIGIDLIEPRRHGAYQPEGAALKALQGQHELSICFGLPHTRFDAPGVRGSMGTQCVAPVDGPIQEVTFTRAARLYKLKLTKGGAPLPRSTNMITDLSRREEAVAR